MLAAHALKQLWSVEWSFASVNAGGVPHIPMSSALTGPTLVLELTFIRLHLEEEYRAFSGVYVNHSSCCSTRYTLLTGRWSEAAWNEKFA